MPSWSGCLNSIADALMKCVKERKEIITLYELKMKHSS